MPNPHGTFIWYELLAADADAAQPFYEKVVGWSFAPFPNAEMDYRIASAPDGAGVGGLMRLPDGPEGENLRPGWFGYIGVDDVDATVASITEAGGTVHVPAMDLEGVGRMAMVADPQGVVFQVMRGSSPDDSTAFSMMADGHCSWNELITTDQDDALQFYNAMFGWERSGTMPMGPMGDYTFISHGGEPIGAMMNKAAEMPAALWNYYFRVSGIDAAAERIKASGGQVIFGPEEVPGGDWVVNGIDPQGGFFGLVGSK